MRQAWDKSSIRHSWVQQCTSVCCLFVLPCQSWNEVKDTLKTFWHMAVQSDRSNVDSNGKTYVQTTSTCIIHNSTGTFSGSLRWSSTRHARAHAQFGKQWTELRWWHLLPNKSYAWQGSESSRSPLPTTTMIWLKWNNCGCNIFDTLSQDHEKSWNSSCVQLDQKVSMCDKYWTHDNTMYDHKNDHGSNRLSNCATNRVPTEWFNKTSLTEWVPIRSYI